MIMVRRDGRQLVKRRVVSTLINGATYFNVYLMQSEERPVFQLSQCLVATSWPPVSYTPIPCRDHAVHGATNRYDDVGAAFS